MIVSNFYIGFCPPLEDPHAVTTNDEPRWCRSYFLQITNLSSQALTFEVEYRVTYAFIGGITEPLEASMNRLTRLDWKHDVNGIYATYDQLLNSNASQIWDLYPSYIEQVFWTPYVQGYAILRVPAVASEKDPSLFVPQSKTSVPVLLNAWHQELRLQHVADSDLETCTQCDIPLAAGTAYNEIVPDTSPVVHPLVNFDKPFQKPQSPAAPVRTLTRRR